MELPIELPRELYYLNVAKDEKMLLSMLMKLPPDLITFFEYACDDPKWRTNHPDFMTEIIKWITIRSFEEKLLEEFCQRAALAIRRNFADLSKYLYRNLTFSVEDQMIPQNSLLWSTESDFFHDHIRIECREKNISTIVMEHLSYEIFLQIEEFVEYGEPKNLWRKTQPEVLEVFKDATDWDFPALMEHCEHILKNYITPENIVETILMAHKNHWYHLKKTALEYFNSLRHALYFNLDNIEQLHIELFNFKNRTLKIFKELEQSITHLSMGGSLADQPEYLQVIISCPKLVGIGFRESNAFNQKFLEIPQDIKDLDLSKCHWLKGEHLKSFAERYPNIKNLSLANNTQLKYDDWSELYSFKKLEALDLSRCHQIVDDDLRIIQQACRGVKKIKVLECLHISDNFLVEAERTMPGMIEWAKRA